MILSAKSRYAVMAMVDLAGRGAEKPVVLAELAEAQQIPLPYLEQIFAQLRREGLVESIRGPGGGYRLARDAGAISIADIVASADESLKMTRCSAEEGGCLSSKGKCLTHDLWEGLGEHIAAYLSGIYLAEIVQEKR